MKLEKQPRFLISEKEIITDENEDISSKMAEILLLKDKTFSPSGIERHPKTGSFFIIGAKGIKMIIEIAPSGKILGKAKLDPKVHRQPEGITFLKDHSLIICNEGAGRKAVITIYPSPNN